MIETEDEDLGKIAISCDRFGGTRPAVSCVHFDRYRSCRRGCLSLKKLLTERPDFAKTVEDYFEQRAEKARITGGGLFECKSNQSGKNLPDPVLGCKFCNFVGKSPRGLRIHMRRTHKVILKKE